MDNGIATKLRKEPVVVAMLARMIIIGTAAYGITLDEQTVIPIILGVWGLVEVGSTLAARSQVVPNVKLINPTTGEAKARIPDDVKEKLDGHN